ncbi:MAG: stage III sporulation protein AF [Clostridia bacterium]|nr:stage III sporulation protein AF [Clostridia bacterium]
MTNSIYICATSLCCSLVVCAIVKFISPTGNTTKIMTLVISVFMMCAMISPVCTALKNIKLSENKYVSNIKADDFTAVYDKQVLKQTAEYINEYTKALMNEANIYPENIETIIAVNESSGIYIRKMNIYIQEEKLDKTEEIKELVSSAVGTIPEVMTE